MEMISALILAVAQPVTSAAPAADWRPLGIAGERFSLSWDAASVQRGTDLVTVRFRTEAAQSPATAPHAISRLEIRCATATMRVVETVTYAVDGSVVRRDTTPPPFESIPPGSHVAVIQRAVC